MDEIFNGTVEGLCKFLYHNGFVSKYLFTMEHCQGIHVTHYLAIY